jgi:uncharacterized heparinase superfamily protein
MDALRYWRTLRHLRPVQVYGRAWFRLHRPRPQTSPAPQVRAPRGRFARPAALSSRTTGPSRFGFLNHKAELTWPGGWTDPAQEKLWLYNLHYFDDLNATDAPRTWLRDLVGRWIDDNPPGAGVGWEPYPLSLRMVNWIKWALGGAALENAWVHSLAVQARWLRRRIEWHLLGNHLIANAKALVFAGTYFEGPEADAWRALGLRILGEQLTEQVLPDGGHFELSPMYHAIVLIDLIDLVNLAAAYPGVLPGAAVASWTDAIRRMRAWLAVMRHPDGEIAFFNDAAFGAAPPPSDVEDYARACGLGDGEAPVRPLVHLADSGYVRFNQADCALIADVGAVGPDHQPGHAHADTLSFEMSLGAERLIVNTGVSSYGDLARRAYERGTAAHTTVVLDGEDSSEVWAAFRVGRRARPFGLELHAGNDAIRAACAHDGYRRLAGRPVHRREWTLSPGALRIRDSLESARPHAAAAWFHLAPGVQATVETEEGGCSGRLVTAEGRTLQWRSTAACELRPDIWRPRFGGGTDSSALVARTTGPEIVTEFSWTPCTSCS